MTPTTTPARASAAAGWWCAPSSIDFRGVPTQNTIIGNTALYGATTGEAFFSGVAGERFAVRLSGATAVVEGDRRPRLRIHDRRHRARAGQDGAQLRRRHESGGVAYVYDEDGQFARRCNTAMVALEPVSRLRRSRARTGAWHNGLADEVQLRKLLEDHNRWTGSKRARELLDHWEQSRGRFVKVFPTEYKRALDGMAARKAAAAAAARNTTSTDSVAAS